MVSVIVLSVISIIIGVLVYHKVEKDSIFAVLTSIFSFILLGGILFFAASSWTPGNVVNAKDYPVYEATNKEAYYINDSNEIVKVSNLSYYNVLYGNVLKPTVRKKEYDNTYFAKFPTFELILPNRDIVED